MRSAQRSVVILQLSWPGVGEARREGAEEVDEMEVEEASEEEEAMELTEVGETGAEGVAKAIISSSLAGEGVWLLRGGLASSTRHMSLVLRVNVGVLWERRMMEFWLGGDSASLRTDRVQREEAW